jgi:hypothetical protein
MWPIFGGLLWNLKTKFQTPPILSESIAESLVASNIMSFRRRIPARGNDLFTAFSCEALLKDFHTTWVSVTVSSCFKFMGASSKHVDG